MSKIAWYGAGMMGSGFVENLRRHGHEVTVWNRTFEKAKALETFGARAVEDPRAALDGAERVHLILSDDAAVDGLLERITDAIPKGTMLLDHTTVAPQPTARRCQRMEERGIAFLHAPVFMGPKNCREGTGLMMVGGPAERVERARPFLEAMTGTLWFVGERPDKAAILKLLGNEMLIGIVAALADGFRMVQAAGLDPREAYELFERFKPGGTIEFRGKAMVEGTFHPAAFELSMARKDVRLMLETAGAGGREVPIVAAVAARIDELLARGLGDADMAALGYDVAPVPG